MMVGRVAPWTRSGGATARAGVLTFPRSIGMVLADPAAVLAEIAFHRSPLLPRITLTADLAYSGALGRDRLNHGYLDRRKALFKRSNSVPKIVPACCQRRGEDRIRGVGAIRHPRSLLFGGNVAIEELNSPIEVDNHLPDLRRLPYDGFARIKMTLAFHLHTPNGLSRHTLGCFPRAHTTGRKILATCQPLGLVFGHGRGSGTASRARTHQRRSWSQGGAFRNKTSAFRRDV